jgi:hypothetical protein
MRIEKVLSQLTTLNTEDGNKRDEERLNLAIVNICCKSHFDCSEIVQDV